jgi:hypothetical protein
MSTKHKAAVHLRRGHPAVATAAGELDAVLAKAAGGGIPTVGAIHLGLFDPSSTVASRRCSYRAGQWFESIRPEAQSARRPAAPLPKRFETILKKIDYVEPYTET